LTKDKDKERERNITERGGEEKKQRKKREK
jgi:hypothetical protein